MAPAVAADLAALARLLEATARRTRNLRREQRYDDARRNALALETQGLQPLPPPGYPGIPESPRTPSGSAPRGS